MKLAKRVTVVNKLVKYSECQRYLQPHPRMKQRYLVFAMMFTLCGSQGVTIQGCNNGKLDMFDDSPSTFTCECIPGDRNVQWHLNDVEIGQCGANGSCTVSHRNQVYNFSRSANSDKSHMTIWSEQRSFKNRFLRCWSGTVADPHWSQNCSLIIKSHPVLERCSITSTGEMVIGSCQVTRAYSSDGHYRCLWKMNHEEQNVSQPENTELINDTEREYLKNWTCYFTQPLPEEERVYTFAISTDPLPVQECFGTIKTGPEPRNGDGSSQNLTLTWVILGVSIAVLVMTIIAIVGVCIARRRRGQQQDQGLPNLQQTERTQKPASERADYVRMQTTILGAREDEGCEFEEHINIIYGDYGGQRQDNKDDCTDHINAVYATVDKTSAGKA